MCIIISCYTLRLLVPGAPVPSISDIEGNGRLDWHASWHPLSGPGGSVHLGWHRALGLSETSRICLQSRASQGLIRQASHEWAEDPGAGCDQN